MAGHLARAGHHVTVYNRTPARGAGLGLRIRRRRATTPREAVAGAQIVFACVGSDDDLRSVVLGRTARSPAWRRARSSSTTPPPRRTWPAAVRASQGTGTELHRRAGFRRPGRRREWRADHHVRRRAGGLRRHQAGGPGLRARRHAGRSPGAGQLAKMVNQICIAGIVQGLSEAVAFGQAADLDMKLVLDVISKARRKAGRWKTVAAPWSTINSTSASRWTGCAGPGPGTGRSAQQRRPVALDRAGGPVLRRCAENGRRRWDTSSLIKRLRD